MRHLYTIRRYGAEEFKTLCTNEWASPTEFKPQKWGSPKQDSFTTVPHQVTCPECLIKLIEKKQKEMDKMRANLAVASQPPRFQSGELDPENRGGL